MLIYLFKKVLKYKNTKKKGGGGGFGVAMQKGNKLFSFYVMIHYAA
jgi:hypothetical protein